jgi:quercetin dioxygenase-like cupin family protein
VAKFVNTKEVDWEKSPVNTDIMAVSGKKIGGLLARLEKGTTMDPHRHGEEQLGFVIQGAIEWVIGPKLTPHIAEAGTFYFFEPNELHGIRNTLKRTIVLDMFGPPMKALKHLAVRMHR